MNKGLGDPLAIAVLTLFGPLVVVAWQTIIDPKLRHDASNVLWLAMGWMLSTSVVCWWIWLVCGPGQVRYHSYAGFMQKYPWIPVFNILSAIWSSLALYSHVASRMRRRKKVAVKKRCTRR